MSRKLLGVMGAVLVFGLANTASAVFVPSQDMIIHYDFEGDALNKATGPSSVGVAGDGDMRSFDGGDFVPGKIGQALNFDGVDDYVEVDDTAILGNTTFTFSNKTITVWARKVPGAPGSTNQHYIWNSREGVYRTTIKNYDHGWITMDGANSGNGYEDNVIPLDDVWVHYAMVFEDAGATVNVHHYVNGDLKKTETDAEQHTTSYLENAMMGRRYGGGRFWAGEIDDFRVYDSVLGPSDIVAVMNIPEPTTAFLLAVGVGGLALRRRK